MLRREMQRDRHRDLSHHTGNRVERVQPARVLVVRDLGAGGDAAPWAIASRSSLEYSTVDVGSAVPLAAYWLSRDPDLQILDEELRKPALTGIAPLRPTGTSTAP